MPRNRDWVVSDAGWSATVVQVPPGTTALVPLTSWSAQQLHIISSTQLRPDAPEPTDKMMVERVVGSTIITYPQMEPGTAFYQYTDFALEVLDADLDGVPLVPADYNLADAWTANRSLMWHDHHLALNLTTWWTDRPGYGQYRKIDFDVKTKRRLDPNQVLTLIIDNGGGDLRIEFVNRIRTLLSW